MAVAFLAADWLLVAVAVREGRHAPARTGIGTGEQPQRQPVGVAAERHG